jgi:transcriptional regulator with XRE-family HTH domain
MSSIGQTIYSWRIHRGFTQTDLAERTGVSRPNLSAIEQGSRDLTVQTVRRIAVALRIGAGALVDGITPEMRDKGPNINRYSLDRIARLAAGEWVRATAKERKTAFLLASIMKSKVRWKNIKQQRLRCARLENETFLRLKTELGSTLLRHLIARIEKNLLKNQFSHE